MFFTLLTLDLTTEWYVVHESFGEATRGSSSQWCKLPLLGRHISLCLESPLVITGTRENMMFLFYINSDDITSPPSLLWWDDISNLGSISSRTNWHWFFFFFFLAPFLRTQQIHKVKEAIILWLKTCWDGFSVPTGRTWGRLTTVLLSAAWSLWERV